MPSRNEPIAEITSGRLRLVLFRSGERLSHYVVSDGVHLDAIEHPKFDTPVFTDLHQQFVCRDDLQTQPNILFLCGSAGGRHWSASIEVDPSGGFVFDVGCRVKVAYLPAAVAYLGTGMRLENAGEGPAASLVQTTGEGRLVLPAEEIEPMPATLRWRYRVQ